VGRLRRAQQEREIIQNALDVRGGGGANPRTQPSWHVSHPADARHVASWVAQQQPPSAKIYRSYRVHIETGLFST
jgi:hypothetical protein